MDDFYLEYDPFADYEYSDELTPRLAEPTEIILSPNESIVDRVKALVRADEQSKEDCYASSVRASLKNRMIILFEIYALLHVVETDQWFIVGG